MLSKIIRFVKTNQNDIILIIGVVLISLFSFAMGYLRAKQENKPPLIFEQENYQQYEEDSNNWRRD
jgi:predicted RND superfamily exporter protein